MNELAKKTPTMMEGTDGGMDYYVFAHKGRMALGFKMLGLMPGTVAGGNPDSVAYIIRFRSARLPTETYEQLSASSSVVPFADTGAPPSEAFNMPWDKKDPHRASMIATGFFSPMFALNDNNELIGGDDIRNGKARQQFLDKLKSALPPNSTQVLSDDEVLEIMQTFEDLAARQAKQGMLTKKFHDEVVSESSGVISSQNELAVKIKKKIEAVDPSLVDPETEDTDEGGEEGEEDYEDDDEQG